MRTYNKKLSCSSVSYGATEPGRGAGMYRVCPVMKAGPLVEEKFVATRAFPPSWPTKRIQTLSVHVFF